MEILDLKVVAYRALLMQVGASKGADRAAYWGTVEVLIAEYGNTLCPAELAEKIAQTSLRSDVKDPLIRIMKLLDKLVKPEAQHNDVLATPKPVFVLLESSVLSPDLLLPIQTIVENALRRPLRDGRRPKLWLINDEHTKRSGNLIIVERDQESTNERRHGPDSIVVDAQRPSSMDKAFLGGATIIAVFRLLSHKEIRVIKDAFAMCEGVPTRSS